MSIKSFITGVDHTVASIVSDFDNIVNRLDRYSERKYKEILEIEDQVLKYKSKQQVASNEANQATVIAGNIKKLLNK